ncbi:MAG: alkaline phosphatase family protein, partial [Dehalococcoidia bacterium]
VIVVGLGKEAEVDAEALRVVTRENKGDTSPRWKETGDEASYREAGADMNGLAQSLLLFGSDDQPPPIFTFHEITLTDGVGHEYGTHSEAERDAIIESDRRIGKILSLLDKRGLFESTTFVLTADHGMANIDTALAADQVQAVPEAGIKSVATWPLVYLLDMDVEVVAQADGRTATVTVLENDEDERGEKPPIEGADVQVIGHKGEVLAATKTDAFGVAGVAFPSDEDPQHMVITVEHEKFNHRHVRLDGSSVFEVDARKRLYGDSA